MVDSDSEPAGTDDGDPARLDKVELEGPGEIGAPAAAGAGRGGDVPGRLGRQRGSRRLIAAGVVVTVALAGIVAGLVLSSGSTQSQAPTAASSATVAATGTVVAVSSSDQPVISDASGGHRRVLPGVGLLPGETLAISPDRALLAGSLDGTVVVYDDRLTSPVWHVKAPPGDSPALADPFADGDKALILTSGTPKMSAAPITIITNTGDGHAMSLGVGDGGGVAGDPRSLGAFVAVPASAQPSIPSPAQRGGLVDSRLEWRAVGRAPITMVTTNQLDAAVRQHPATAVHLAAYPNPKGDKLAIVLDPPDQVDSNAALVVIDRHGRILSATDDLKGPSGTPFQPGRPTGDPWHTPPSPAMVPHWRCGRLVTPSSPVPHRIPSTGSAPANGIQQAPSCCAPQVLSATRRAPAGCSPTSTASSRALLTPIHPWPGCP